MIQLIVGAKGKGKTKHLLEKVNNAVKTVDGNIVYLDKNSKHMYELKNRIRLINTSEFPFSTSEEFLGFLCGIVSQDHDLQEMYLDGFLKCAKLKEDNITDTILKLDAVSTLFNIDFIISVSVAQEDLDERLKDKVLLSL